MMRKLGQKIHASWTVVLFACGIIIGDILVLVLKPKIFADTVWLVLAFVLLLVAIIISRRVVIWLAFLAGVILVCNRAAPDFMAAEQIESLVGSSVTVTGKIAKDPDESSGKWNLNLGELEFQFEGGETLKIPGQIFTQVSNLDIERSDMITISGTLSEGFGSYAATIFRPNVIGVQKPEPGDLFLKFRNFFAEGIKNYLPTKQAGLAMGYLLGQKSGVDDGLEENLRTVGLTHIIVASGAHLGVLVSIARKIFGKLSRFASLLSGLLFMILFIGVTGLSASMLRAGMVTGLSLIAWYFGREIKPWRLILMVAAATLVVNPMYLTDLAWLLSFASFSGILIVAPWLMRFFYGKDRKPKMLGSTLISSVAAALLCTPILLYFFGSVSLISIFANVLILPTISVAMGFTFLTGVFAILLSPVAGLVGQITMLILNYQIAVVEFFGDKKMFLVTVPAENPLVFLLYAPIGVVIFTTFLLRQRKQKLKKGNRGQKKLEKERKGHKNNA